MAQTGTQAGPELDQAAAPERGALARNALGLGDGIGMNLVTPHGSPATQLEALAAAHS